MASDDYFAQGNTHGVNLLPIPPPLEFPYPRSSADSPLISAASTEPQTDIVAATNAIAGLELTGSPTATIPDNTLTPHTRPRKSLARFVTEGPTQKQRIPSMGLRRYQTAKPLNASLWDTESDSSSSSSSSEEELSPSKIIKKERRPSTGDSKVDKNKARSGIKGLERHSSSRFTFGNNEFQSQGHVSKRDGRLNIKVKGLGDTQYWAKALGATLAHLPGHERKEDGWKDELLPPLREEDHRDRRPDFTRASTALTASTARSYDDRSPVPQLNIVVMVIGSRGDIQPFLRLGKVLKEQHGHRVRIATHPAFKKFVEQDSGLEFFSVKGDPAELMAFMVKNPGLMPSAQTLMSGEIGRRRNAMNEMLHGFWRACVNATDDEDDRENRKMMDDHNPFVADVIIANPPSLAHIHCAERLGIPLHLLFTFPYSPTQQFPHPLTNIKQSNVDSNFTNFISYPLVEMMVWQGLGDLVNRFRQDILGLDPLSTLWAPGQLFRLKVPYTYLWSPGMIPKPADWGPEIDVTGFVFLDLASSFKPPDALAEFLMGGEPPVYIGFGSIVVDDPQKFTKLIFDAVKMAGIRALVSEGWGGLGDKENTPDNIFMLGNTPHDWLFPKVRAVVHHGGAGTTAIGLKCGKPTMIVPFFGDQPFWGAMVAKAGAGAEPIPYKKLTAEKLAESIKILLSPEVQQCAEQIAKNIAQEGDGAINAVKSFHRSLLLRGEHSLRCSVLEEYVAVWSLKKTHLRLSAVAADILVESGRLRWHDLRLLRHCEWNDFEGPGEPVTGATSAVLSTVGRVMGGLGRIPFGWNRKIRKRRERDVQKKNDKVVPTGTSEGNSEAPAPVDKNPDQAENGPQGIAQLLPKGNTMSGELREGRSRLTTQGNPTVDGLNLSESRKKRVHIEPASEENIAQEIVADAGDVIAESGIAIAKAPMDIFVAITQGFHNAPRLYGDSTVRKPTRITGYRSGLKAGGKEFAYGLYDGWTGLVKHPYMGAKQQGPVGFAKGIGKGVGGFVLKDLAAVFGPVAFTLKGFQKEYAKRHNRQNDRIRHARVLQGRETRSMLSPTEQTALMERVGKAWQIITDVQQEMDGARRGGIKGRWAVRKERKKWERHGVLQNVDLLERALRAERDGVNFDDEFKAWRRENERSKRPRKMVMGARRKSGLPQHGGRGRRGKDGQGGMNGDGDAKRRSGVDVVDHVRRVSAA